ncbi:hypothetical protein LTR10_019920 [Elasticomyces elasticus]|uniref:MmgE/PrpD family protein n=1 Tax=Exophiala sideris TaxID=1016849 RepID=A0ABR0J9H9_9EURO|nr:hypothetical protein LTR10_019920 [Elasticomyces elasticus]KAK5022757.1 hypothetical protein LTS07_009734 [Exophiala sideris]KAK5026659.1 hypothetical protein LTR13_009882 [Exophiala sideris]KAK5059384.1 hypothetical protein LTR69_005972 [Exophiala sideris]KAK5177471.1 hypothetical protein LTR44_010088 [Eurotiomycetes sp. CCFEE 6388]
MATQRLASWATSLQYADLPPQVKQAAIRSLYNWTGCALGGSNHQTTTKALKALSPFFGKPTSSILGRASRTGNDDLPTRADASHAALINGIASHVHDYDDTHLETIIHPTGPVASALLAQAEASTTKVSGEEFLLALVAGIEAECKVGLAVWPKHYDVGWHITSTTGSIGAAVAVGKLLNLSEEQMAHAIGIAATQVTGLREMFGSDTKCFHVGRSAQNGLMAAVLASNGYTSSLQALEAKRGWANVVSEKQNLTEQIDSLGKVWETEKNSFKPFPCGIVVHPIIDGCIQLHHDIKEKGLSVSDITKIHTRVHPLVLELTGKKTPKDGLQAKFSVYHGGAVGLAFGKAGPAQYEDEVVTSQPVTSIRDKIDAVADEKLGADEAEIVAEFADGQKLSKHIEHAIGSLEAPMTDKQLEQKFLDQVGQALGQEVASQASKSCWAIAETRSLGDVVNNL